MYALSTKKTKSLKPAEVDLIEFGPHAEDEKNRLLEVVGVSKKVSFVSHLQFSEWATKRCNALKERGYWANFTDPCSGYPVTYYLSHLTVNRQLAIDSRHIIRMFLQLKCCFATSSSTQDAAKFSLIQDGGQRYH